MPDLLPRHKALCRSNKLSHVLPHLVLSVQQHSTSCLFRWIFSPAAHNWIDRCNAGIVRLFNSFETRANTPRHGEKRVMWRSVVKDILAKIHEVHLGGLGRDRCWALLGGNGKIDLLVNLADWDGKVYKEMMYLVTTPGQTIAKLRGCVTRARSNLARLGTYTLDEDRLTTVFWIELRFGTKTLEICNLNCRWNQVVEVIGEWKHNY